MPTNIKMSMSVDFNPSTTFTLTCHHNTPKEDRSLVKRGLNLIEVVKEVKLNMPLYRSIDVMSEQTGEIIYQRYFDLDFYEMIGESLDNAQ
jgi:hypothetical protein